jgi:thioredoxin-related protein
MARAFGIPVLLAVLFVRSESSHYRQKMMGHAARGERDTSDGFGRSKPAENFDDEVSKHFIESNTPSHAKESAKKQNKPLLVLLTRKGCGDCQNLKSSVNRGKEVKQLLEKFVVVHAENEKIAQWQLVGHEYAPQTMIFPPGEEDPLPINGHNKDTPYSLNDDAT